MAYDMKGYDVLRDTPISAPTLVHVDQETGEAMANGGEGVSSYCATVRCMWSVDENGAVKASTPKVALSSAYQQGAPKAKKDGTARKVSPKWHFQPGALPTFGVPPLGAWIVGSKISPRFALGKAGRALLAGSLAAHDAVSKAHAANPAALTGALTAQIQAVWADLSVKMSA